MEHPQAHKITSTLLAGVLCLPTLLYANQNWPASSIATAYERGSNQVLYTERRQMNAEDKTSQVAYKQANGDTFATKTFDYSRHPKTPDYHFTDLRDGKEIKVAVVDNNNVKFELRPDGNSDWKPPKTQSLNDRFVVDAGFDFAVREHWQTLDSGEAVKFIFGVPNRQSAFGMRIKNFSCTEESDADYLCLRVRPSNFFFRLLVDKIDLIYTRKDQRLYRFIGRSDIPADNGDPLEVNVVFQYDDWPAETTN